MVACLAYYAERCSDLERCVLSLAGVADVLVALEGRWGHFPEVEGNEQALQRATIEEAALRTGIVCDHSSGTWPSQVAKRSALMERAAGYGDWLLVIDADEWVMEADAAQLRAALAATRLDVARVNLRRHPLATCSPARAVRRIYRASCGVRLRTAHNGYVAKDGRFLHGDPAYVELAESDDGVAAYIHLGHDTAARNGARQQARLVYLATRRQLRFESWQQERKPACVTP
jgi:hypothetical protein